ncbi:MAG: hypothetical protein FWE85_00815 [Clostridiales bacterium]|nr:hypothetical protein [Clostridiales bacterium]
MKCLKCGGTANVQIVAEIEPLTIGMGIIYSILLLIPVIGWAIIFASVKNILFRTVSYCVCQSCGHRERID